MIARTRFALALAAFLVSAASTAGAQDATQLPLAAATASVPAPAAQPAAQAAGPTMESARLGVQLDLAPNTEAAAAQARQGKPVALMIVGGAAVLTGLIIGSDAGYAIAVGGAVVGLYGLYQYLK